MSHIFVSYSSNDSDYAKKLHDHLFSEGFEVWLDRERLKPGTRFTPELERAVKECAALIVIMSPEAKDSPWVENEVLTAKNAKKLIFPVLLRGQNWDMQFAGVQYTDLRDGSMPSSDFIENLSHHVPAPRKARNGHISSDLGPQKNNSLEANVNPPKPADLVNKLYLAIEQKNWTAALGWLEQIKLKTTTFPVETYQKRMQDELNKEKWGDEAKEEYEMLLLMRDKESDTDLLWSVLKEFWKKYPGYDPANLASIDPIKPLLATIEGNDVSPHTRASAGRKLAYLSDPREGVGTNRDGYPEFAWCEIPSGEFHMGGDEHVRNVRPDLIVNIPYTYWVSRYPITYAQFQPFVNLFNGYDNVGLWTKDGWEWKQKEKLQHPKLHWNEPEWHLSNHPVVFVSWYEAYAYTQWLNTVISHINLPSSRNYQGLVIRLLTEAEWEKAARGPNGRLFPYGNEPREILANINTLNLKRSVAVGIFPEDRSAYGVMDLAGNVWDWCISEEDHPLEREVINPEKPVRRVIKGGSWKYYQEYSRAASYAEMRPSHASDEAGFRICILKYEDQDAYFPKNSPNPQDSTSE